MPPPLLFRDRQRIRRAGEFAALKRLGRREFSRTAVMNWRPAVGRGYSRLGLVISKKQAGKKAVARHRARRLLREAFRRLQHKISPPADIVLIARKEIGGCPQSRVDRDLASLLKRAGILEAAP